MELSPGKQRVLFVVVVVLLAGLGIYLVGPGRSHGAGAASSSPAASPGGLTESASPVGVPSAVVAPTPLPVPVSIKNANIYNWLPFTQQDLDEAANVTVAFAAADETFSYIDTPKSYGQRLSSLVTPTLLATLEQQFQPPGAASTWRQQQLTSKSGGTINRITAFGASPPSITFVITLTEQTTASGKTTSTTGQYDVTTVAVAGGWQVNDIEQHGVGNQ
jgi:hypothetical protein